MAAAGNGVVLTNLNLTPGHCVEIKALVPADCNGFAINLGKDASNLLLHFNARFLLHGDTRIIVCNSKEADAWGAEQRENAFPFQQGAETMVCFEYQSEELIVKLSSGELFSFPVRMPLDSISFLSLEGIQMKSITVE